MTEVEALKKAVAEAEKKATTEQALREKHETRVMKLSRSFKRPLRNARPWSRV